ncbi:DedA family protein [Alicyclobacillus fastidiosus]|uniref:DedA family protein n=1 Tax=Alicyclobacillus fastidiosus TaxID=392011 RepID=A0ABY6ZMX7_9BACL|nr:DedA family protein [Alicyclobacillus fastidiosus]WAH44185.1 DedA family protein [Alicyclobacillus fastidiosus]GMA60499.1 alkaline phosphatase [Alicyclobacillus fastidiosus]
MSHSVMMLVQSSGYLGIFIAMVLESACIPLPSEVVMPFGGYLVSTGHLQFTLVVLVGVLGNVTGSTIAYAVGRYGGRRFISRYGRLVLLSQRHLQQADRFFARRGEVTVLVCRLLPALRTFISLPAGIAKMKFGRFLTYSVIGTIPWVLILTYVGLKLSQNWGRIEQDLRPLTMISAVVLVVVVVGFWIFANRKRDSRE